LQYAYHRTLGRKTALSRRAAYRGELLDEEAAVVGVQRGLTPEECGWVIRAGLAQLSARQRATLELACFEDLGLREIAARLGVTVGCARHYYYRGLARLQKWARTAICEHAAARSRTGETPMPSRRRYEGNRRTAPPSRRSAALRHGHPAAGIDSNGLPA
jgi:hypothetical protein